MGTSAAASEAGTASKRRYSSPLRKRQAETTRAAVLAAAGRQFLANGWAGTAIRDVARAANVSVETVYAHFESKTALLRRVIDSAVVGDDAEVPLAERPDFLAIGRGSRRDRINAAAGVAAAVHSATAPFARLLQEAAATDTAMAAELADARRRQRVDVRSALSLILGRPPADVELDGINAILSPEVFLLLTETNGWSVALYREWIADALDRLLSGT